MRERGNAQELSTSGSRPIRPSNMAGWSSSIWARPGREPLFPAYDIIDPDRGEDVVLRGMRLWGDYAVGMVRDCNWLQHYENIVDPYHLLMLHQMISGDQFQGALMQGSPRIGWERTPLGVRYNLIKDLPNGNRMVRHAECIVPQRLYHPQHPRTRHRGEAPGARHRTLVGGAHRQRACARHQHHRLAPGKRRTEAGLEGRHRYDQPTSGRARSLTRSYEERQRKPDDLEAQEGQRTIAVHALENLAPSDTGDRDAAAYAARAAAARRGRAATRSTWCATRRPTAASRPTPGTRSCRRPRRRRCSMTRVRKRDRGRHHASFETPAARAPQDEELCFIPSQSHLILRRREAPSRRTRRIVL